MDGVDGGKWMEGSGWKWRLGLLIRDDIIGTFFFGFLITVVIVIILVVFTVHVVILVPIVLVISKVYEGIIGVDTIIGMVLLMYDDYTIMDPQTESFRTQEFGRSIIA